MEKVAVCATLRFGFTLDCPFLNYSTIVSHVLVHAHSFSRKHTQNYYFRNSLHKETEKCLRNIPSYISPPTFYYLFRVSVIHLFRIYWRHFSSFMVGSQKQWRYSFLLSHFRGSSVKKPISVVGNRLPVSEFIFLSLNMFSKSTNCYIYHCLGPAAS